MITAPQKDRLANRVDSVTDSHWYLTLFGLAYEETDGDFERSLKVADRAIAECPAPPPTAADEQLRRLEDALDGRGLTVNETGFDKWITVKGQHIMIPAGKDQGEAISEHFEKLKAAKEGHGKHGGHDEHGHELEHLGHQAHTAHEAHQVAEILGGSHEAHKAVEAVRDVHHSAEAASKAAGLAHPTHLDAAAIISRHAYGPALAAAAKLIKGASCGKPCERVGNAIANLHDGATKVAEKATGKLVERYGHATAAAILGSGALLSHSVMGSVGIHGPLASLIPAPHFIGAIPLVAAAEVGKRLGLLDPHSKLEQGLSHAGTWVHAIRGAVGKPFKAAAGAGLKGAKVLGKATRKLGETVKGGREMANNETDVLGNALVDYDKVTLSKEEIDAAAKEFVKELQEGFAKLVDAVKEE